MIHLAECSAAIAAESHDVFAYVTDMERYQDWFPGVIGIRSTDSLPPATVGKRYRETIELPSGPTELVIEVVDAIENELFVTEGQLDGILPRMTIKFSGIDDNYCLTVLRYDSREPNLKKDLRLLAALRGDLQQRAQIGLTNVLKRFSQAG